MSYSSIDGFGMLFVVLIVMASGAFSVATILNAHNNQSKSQAQMEWDQYKDECNGTIAGRNLKDKTIRVICEDGQEYFVPYNVEI